MNNTTLDTSDPGLDAASLVIGIFYLTISTIFLMVYIPTLIVMWGDKELMSKAVYNLLVWDCISDLIQVIGLGFVSGGMTLANSVGSRTFNRLVGAMTCIAWLSGAVLDISVALNRLMSVHSPNLARKYYGGWKVKIWIVGAWTYGLTMNICYITLGEGVVYDMDLKAWCFKDFPGSTRDIVSTLEIIQDGITQPVLFILCVAIAIKVMRKRRDTSTAQLTQKEKNAIYQVFTISIALMGMCFLYFLLAYTWNNPFKMFVGNTLWLSCAGWTPMVLLKFNSTLRYKVKNVFRTKGTVVSNMIFPITSKQGHSTTSQANINSTTLAKAYHGGDDEDLDC